MADNVLSVASKVVEYLLAPIGRQCGYVIFSDRYIGELKKELDQLESARQRVQHSIDEARNNMKQIEADVKEWVEKVETVASKARDMLDCDGRAKKTCFYGWLPNLKEHYCLGRDATNTVQAIQKLLQVKFERVYYESAPPGRVAGAPNVNSSAGSDPSISQGIMKAVEDEKLKVIGVYGPGGVGKTTLLEEVEKKLRKEGRPFHMIIKAKVSQSPVLKNIQDEIADALKLDLKDVQSESGRGNRLLERLQRDPSEKVLIILDDLWDKLDLKAVGIPSGAESRGCKLLLSSRFKDVLEQKMLADRTFRLEGLSSDEAFRLFEKIVGDRLKDEELKRIAAEVVKKLAGLPLLIISVASTLKYGGVSAWKNALIKIDESNISIIETIVKLSYDHLKSEDAKALFLLCGLIGGTIRVKILLALGMGLGLFEGFNNTIEDSRDRLNTRLDELRSACLLLDGGDDKDNVTIHDLYSEIVVSTPFRGHNSLMMNSNYGSWSKEKLEKCWAICQVNVGSDGLAELMRCGFPELKILMLSQPEAWDRRPAHRHDEQDCCRLDFTYMKELRVIYLGSMDITALPSSIEFLEKLQSLYLDYCYVGDVAIIGKLKALQILSFAGSNISGLPQEIGKLTNLRSLNLSECHELQTIEPGVLKSLIKLEELHMKGSFDQWVGKDEIPSELCNPGLAELKSLTKIASLEISIPDPTILLEDDDLPFGNLIRFWINIGDPYGRTSYGRTFGSLRTMKLKLGGCNSILSKEWLQKNLQNTQYLHLGGLKELEKNAHELCTHGFRELKHLDIDNSPSIKYIANSSYGLPLTAFTILESLFLKNLINLEKICNGPIAPECFSKLKAVSIEECHRLKNLWFLSEMQRLVHLEVLHVRKCSSMQAIVTSDAGKVEVAADDIVELPNVRSLDLRALSKMTSFCTGAEGAPIQVSLPRLESLVMSGLPGLEEILYSEPSIKYTSLKSLEISVSNSTLSILKLDSILKLPNLESMRIDRCLSAEVVFDLEELKVTGDAEILSRLTTLKLFYLPNLWCMWKLDVQLQGISRFRNLETLSVFDTRLSFLFPVSVAKCLREIRVIDVAKCPNMKAVIVDEEGRDEGTYDIIEFPLLERLRIGGCPTEKFFSCPHGKKESVTTTSDSQDAYSDSFFDPKVSLPSLETLYFHEVGSFKRIWHGDLPRSSFYKLATLTVANCSELLNVFPSTIIGRLHNLKSVKVEDCPSLESLFDCGSLDANTEQTSVLLPKLEEVKVREAGKLRSLVKSDSQMICGFPSLKVIKVEKCYDMKYLFPHFIATTLEKLESIDIWQCKRMEEVVPKEEGGRSKADVMTFPSLRHLTILQCPNFGAFIRNPASVKRQSGETAEKNDDSPQSLFNEMVTFPNIRSLAIEGLRCKELWNNQIPADSFWKLESLQLENCDNLQHIASSHMWKRLQCCLEILRVISCRSIEIIYEGDGKDTKSSKLRTLVLRYLENLRHIWQSDGLPNVPFPNLRYVEAVRCSHLEMLFATFTAKFLGQIEELVVESCEDMELIAGHEKWEEATGMTITFSKLTVLRLFELPKFRSFLPEKHSLKLPYSEDFPSLQDLSIVSCGAEPDRGTVHWEGQQRRRQREPWRTERWERRNR